MQSLELAWSIGMNRASTWFSVLKVFINLQLSSFFHYFSRELLMGTVFLLLFFSLISDNWTVESPQDV